MCDSQFGVPLRRHIKDPFDDATLYATFCVEHTSYLAIFYLHQGGSLSLFKEHFSTS